MKKLLKKLYFFLHVKYWLCLKYFKIWEGDNSKIKFISENKNWSIYNDGINITRVINSNKKNIMKIIFSPKYYENNVIHFGSQYMWVDWYKFLNKKNKYIVTFFHGKIEDGPDTSRHIKNFIESEPFLAAIITSSSIVKKRLISWGIPKEKLFLIPIGVDLNVFYPISHNLKKGLRKQYKIEKDEIVIGSFQKDGQGWGQGNLPKLIKGPDIFLKVIKILKKRGVKIKVFLTGPARGYIKNNLNHINVPYIHEFLEDYNEINLRYRMLDVYLITSREEGGPKGLIEAMASGIPVVSTNVGMSSDLIENRKNGFISYDNDPYELANYIIQLINERQLSLKYKNNGLSTVKNISWNEVGNLHYKKVYNPLLNNEII